MYRSGPCDRNSPISSVSSIAVAGNTIPIKSTHTPLVWGSVKTGKSETKEFTIRNTSNNKIKIQIDICDDNKSFKVLYTKIVYIHIFFVTEEEFMKFILIYSFYSYNKFLHYSSSETNKLSIQV